MLHHQGAEGFTQGKIDDEIYSPLAEAVAEVGRFRELPEHARIKKQIAAKMSGINHQPAKGKI
ncbi:MAG: hypothetical protein WCO68_05770 [Verrucomicrobiota bacterium]